MKQIWKLRRKQIIEIKKYQILNFHQVLFSERPKKFFSMFLFALDDRYLAVGTHDNFVDIYNVESEKREFFNSVFQLDRKNY